jgi:protein phosphatase
VSIDLILALFCCGTDIFRGEPNVLTVPLPVTVVGDLHGNLFDLLRYLNELGPPPETSYLFLGDIVDRGEFSTETLTVLILLKVLYPKHIFLIRGNHEFDEPWVSHTDFYNELTSLYDCDVVRLRVVRLFSFMPVAAVIGSFAFAVHGGVPASLVSLAQLDELRRPLSTFSGTFLEDLVWSDADDGADGAGGARPSPRGFGHLYGIDIVRAFLDRTGLDMIVRGHQWIRSGVWISHQRKVVTVFSASCAASETYGGVLLLRTGPALEEMRFDPLAPIGRSDVAFVTVERARPVISALPRIARPPLATVKGWGSQVGLKLNAAAAAVAPATPVPHRPSVLIAIRKRALSSHNDKTHSSLPWPG